MVLTAHGHDGTHVVAQPEAFAVGCIHLHVVGCVGYQTGHS